MKKIAKFFFNIIYIFDSISKYLTNQSILIWFKDFIEEHSYTTLKISKNKQIILFTPNVATKSSVDHFFVEKETLNWIKSFDKTENLIFWDIGANIGLFSLYNANINPNSITYAFEPSTSNLRVLTRNISINNLEKKIKIIPIPLTNKKNAFQEMNENEFVEGSAFNSFGEKYDFKGKEFKPSMKYSLFGTTMNYFIENSILKIPNHIKIDVDGIEHLIIEGGDSFLKNKKVKSVQIEIDENFTKKCDKILNCMERYEFEVLYKKHNNQFYTGNFKSVYNYLFIKKDL